MLVWVTLLSGLVVCVLGSLAVFRVDRRWRRRHLRCCRCQRTWYGEAKLCYGCGGRGRAYDHREEGGRLPTHDWQGYLDTGPIPVVAAPTAPERPAVDYGHRVWAAPVVERAGAAPAAERAEDAPSEVARS